MIKADSCKIFSVQGLIKKDRYENINFISDLLLTSFYGKANGSGDSSKGTTPDVSADEGNDDQEDLASVVKRRRLLALKAAAEKEQKDKERREQ